MPGVTNNGNQATTFVCTAHSATTLGVEVFDAAGALVGSATGIGLVAGQSATIATQAVALITAYTDLFLGSAFQGSARILVQGGGKVSCSARAISITGSGAGYALPVVKASGQKGQ